VKWPTPQQWLAGVRKAKRVLAASWAAVVVVLLTLWLAFGVAFAGVLIAVTTLPLVVIVALMEMISDGLKGRIAKIELDEFGRKRLAEVRLSFPRPEGIDALAKNKPREEVRRDMPQSWRVSDVPRQPPAPDDEGNAGGESADGGGSGSVS